MGVGLYTLQTFFGLYNLIVNTSKWVLFLPPSDAYVRSFFYLLYTLIKLYYTHTHKKEYFLLEKLPSTLRPRNNRRCI